MSLMDYTDLLPESILDLIDCIGAEATGVLVDRRGGVTLNVPTRPDPEHWLHQALGAEAYHKLVHHYRGEEIWIPRCQAALHALKKQQIIDGKAAGESTVDLALKHGVSDRYVRNVLAEHRAAIDEDQLDLFEDTLKNVGGQPPGRS